MSLRTYSVTTDRFGEVSILATDIKDARRDARRRFGIKNPALVRAATAYATCERCDSSPCCCESSTLRRRTDVAGYHVSDDRRAYPCAVEGCTNPGRAHTCPADGADHHHGMIHYWHCHSTLTFGKEWGLICDEHYAVCVEARRAWEITP